MEKWKPVVGYEGLYEVSDLGRVKSVTRVVLHRNHPTKKGTGDVLKELKGTLLSIGLQKSGRRGVVLCKDGKTKSSTVARLLLEAFVGPANGRLALHRDDNRANDTLDNLYWGTSKQNHEDMIKNGTILQGSKHPNAALTETQVREIRVQLKAGVSHHTLAAIYKSTPTAIQSIKHLRTWKWLN